MECKKTKNYISEVIKNSKAEKLGIEAGDKLIRINNQWIEDIIEYMFLTADEYLEIEIEKKDGSTKTYHVYKDFDEDIGILFVNPIIDQAKSCRNKCIFCFVDQLPPNMRETLYFKDDDSRLSFLQGNFITLTNMSDDDMNKLIKYRISPINVSIHTTNPTLRKEMLNNKTAGNVYDRLKRLAEARISMNGQIVLCPDVNDKEHLEETLMDLSNLYPNIMSVAVVPVGLTKFRDGLYPLVAFNKERAAQVISQVENLQKFFLEKMGTRFVFLSDEFYVLAKKQILHYDDYEGFPQIENGIGLMAKFEHEVLSYLNNGHKELPTEKVVSIATGKSAEIFMKKLCSEIEGKIKNLKINVFLIKNDYFGENITVTGLITGIDIINQLKDKELGDQLMIPSCMLKADEPIFLDDKSIEDLKKELNVKIVVSKVEGKDFIDRMVE